MSRRDYGHVGFLSLSSREAGQLDSIVCRPTIVLGISVMILLMILVTAGIMMAMIIIMTMAIWIIKVIIVT